MDYKERARRFFEKYTPEHADNSFAIATLANQFEEVAKEQRMRDAFALLFLSTHQAIGAMQALGRATAARPRMKG